jgi:hypothetical protein
MKILFTTLIFAVISVSANSQPHHYNSRLSLTSDFGFVNSDVLHNPVNITWCFECESAAELIPKPSMRWSIGVEIRLGKRSYIGVGYMANKIKYVQRSPNSWARDGSSFFQELVLKYQGAQLLYRLALAQHDAWQFSVAIGPQYDHFKEANIDWIVPMRDHNFSGVLKPEFAVSVGRWNQFTLSPIFKMALKRYDEGKFSYQDKFVPFGYGLMFGWRVKLI